MQRPSASESLISPSTFQVDRGLLDALPVMVWFDNAAGECIYLNKASLAFGGRPFEQEMGRGWLDSVHSSDRTDYDALYQQARKNGQAFETEIRICRHDGEYRWVVERGSPIFGANRELVGFLGFRYDTTDRRELDSVRREIEEQVRLLGLATRDWVWSWDARSDRIIHNKAFSAALGEAPGPHAATQTWWQQRVHPADLSRVVGAFTAALRGGKEYVSSEYRIRKSDGAYAYVEDRACFVRDSKGEVARVLGAMRDMTQRKRVEEAHGRFTEILESTSDFVGMYTIGGLILYVNAAGRSLLGWPMDKTIAGAHISNIHPAWAAEIIFEEGVPIAIRNGTWMGETALIAHDGQEIPVSQVIISHRNADGDLEFLSTIIRDISERKREEVTLIEWANRYDAAIRASGQVLFDWNSTTNEITYGGDLEQLIGYSEEEMEGGIDRFRRLIHPDDLLAFDDEIRRVTATRDPFHLGFRVVHRNSRIVHVDAKGYFFVDRAGHIGRMVGFFADVTVQRQAEQALEEAQLDLEARVAARTAELATASTLLKERALQSSAVAQLGQRALVGAPLQELLMDAAALVRQTLRVDFVSILEYQPEAKKLHCIAQSGWPDPSPEDVDLSDGSQSGYTLMTGEPVIVEDLLTESRFQISPSARTSGAASSVSVVIESSPEPIGVLIALTKDRRSFTLDDINFLQSVANVLTAAIDRNRSEAHLRKAQEAAETANRAKSEFLSRMSHELRTPLNAILGFTQLLEIDQPTDSQTESIGHISRAGQHLLSLINEVLDIARIESDRLPFVSEPVETIGFVREVVDLVRPVAQRYRIDLVMRDFDGPEPVIMSDRQRLKQVLLNLLSNGVKYNGPDGRVIVQCVCTNNRVRINVTDSGPGIPEAKLKRLFVPFERLGAESTNIEGTGLGLALSQRIVSALGGELGVHSTIGEGSTFWVEFPTTDAPSEPVIEVAAIPDPEPTPPPANIRKILYVEDQDLNIRLVERILHHRPGYELITAMQGRLALELAAEHRPDVVLLDLNLPDMSGDEVLIRLKSEPDLADIPVIMVSADAMGDRIEELLELGADGYLTKPYKLQEFFAVIEAAFDPPK